MCVFVCMGLITEQDYKLMLYKFCFLVCELGLNLSVCMMNLVMWLRIIEGNKRNGRWFTCLMLVVLFLFFFLTFVWNVE